LHRNFLSDEVCQQFIALGLEELDVDDQEAADGEEDDEYRYYIAVGE
jgi:hypothetical protein